MLFRAALTAMLLAATTSTAVADDVASAGVDAGLTRYHTGFDTHTTWVATFDIVGSVAIGRGGVRIWGRMPLMSSFIEKNACCGFGIGNATLGANAPVYQRGRFSLSGGLSVSAPTAGALDDDADQNPRWAATASLNDAGLFRPDTTTVRADLAGQLRLNARASLGAGVGAQLWLPDGDLLVPLTISAGYQFTRRLGSDVAFTTIAKPDEDEAFRYAIEMGVAWRGRHDAIGARLRMPLDQSRREKDMLGAGVSYTRSF